MSQNSFEERIGEVHGVDEKINIIHGERAYRKDDHWQRRELMNGGNNILSYVERT